MAQHLVPDIEVAAVQYPGRQDRWQEPNIDDVCELAEYVTAELSQWPDDIPVALFGHSLGATVAYECARRLKSLDYPVAALFVSSRWAPHRNRDCGIHRLDGDLLIAEVRELEGTGAPVLTDPEFMQIMLPALRSDYRAAETYHYMAGPRLECPIHALGGVDDRRVAANELTHWQDHTLAEFDVKVFPGGHFYLLKQHDQVMARIAGRILVHTQ